MRITKRLLTCFVTQEFLRGTNAGNSASIVEGLETVACPWPGVACNGPEGKPLVGSIDLDKSGLAYKIQDDRSIY